MCCRSKKWCVAPQSATNGGTWFCCDMMCVASVYGLWYAGSGPSEGSGVGPSLPLHVLHFLVRYRCGHMISLLPPL